MTLCKKMKNVGKEGFLPLDKLYATRAYALVERMRNTQDFAGRNTQIQKILAKVGDVMTYEEYRRFSSHIDESDRFVLTRDELVTFLNTGELNLF